MSPKAKKSKLPSGLLAVLIVLIAVGIIAGAVAGILAIRGGDNGNGGGESIKLPDYAYLATAPRGAAIAYQFAVDFPEYLAAVPCYCGCALIESEAHQNNLDCFIESREGNNVVFDDHASY